MLGAHNSYFNDVDISTLDIFGSHFLLELRWQACPPQKGPGHRTPCLISPDLLALSRLCGSLARKAGSGSAARRTCPDVRSCFNLSRRIGLHPTTATGRHATYKVEGKSAIVGGVGGGRSDYLTASSPIVNQVLCLKTLGPTPSCGDWHFQPVVAFAPRLTCRLSGLGSTKTVSYTRLGTVNSPRSDSRAEHL